METNQTRTKIIEDTFQLLLLKGYDGVSISDIQQATGMSRGILYHYFSNKESLFCETIKVKLLPLMKLDLEYIKDYNLTQMIDYVVSMYDSLVCDKLGNVPIINFDFLFYRALQEHIELTKIYNSIRDDEVTAWTNALQNSISRGEIASTISTARIAKQFVYIADGVWLQAVSPSIGCDLISNLRSAFETQNEMIHKR